MPDSASIVQSYTATRGLAITRLASGDLSVVAHDGGAGVNLTLAQAEAEPFAAVIMDAPPPPPPPPPSGTLVLSSTFDRPDGSTASFADDTGRHTVSGLKATWCYIKNDGAGTSSLFSWNTNHAFIANSADFDFDGPFTVDYEVEVTDIAGTYNIVSNANGPAQTGWTLRQNGANLQFAWFDDTATHRSVDAASVGWVANQRFKVRACKNAAGKFRLFIGGQMKGSGTPANSTIRASLQNLIVNMSDGGTQSRLHSLAITKGVCLHDSDESYTP